MKFTCFLLICLLTTPRAFAQKTYFLYLQTDKQVPFYIKMNDRISSSTSAGYLILSNLVDSTYRLSLGFPSDRTESRFEIKISGKDRGLLIKSAEGGIRLQDLQTAAVIRSQNTAENNVSYQARNDAFTELLSKAANDPGLLFVQVAVKEQKPITESPGKEPPVQVQAETKPKTEPPVDNQSEKDSAIAATASPKTRKGPKDSVVTTGPTLVLTEASSPAHDSIGVSMKKETITNPVIEVKELNTEPPAITGVEAPVYKRSQVKKYSESSTTEGFGLIYLDKGESGTDTIRLVIPNQKFVLKQVEQKEAEAETAMLEIERKTSNKTIQKTDTSSAPCKSIATENDFFKLRRSMAGKTSDLGMVEEARKYFKTKCFSTEQVRNLSALFLTPAGKFDFFSAALYHVTDKNEFSSLQSEFRDDSYIKRFKTLIGE